MAIFYVKSSAVGAGTGADWANAYTTLAAAIGTSAGAGGASGGDTVYVASTHTETSATVSLGRANPGNPILVRCVLEATPVVASAIMDGTTGYFKTSGTLSLYGDFEWYGMWIENANASSVAWGIAITGGSIEGQQIFDNCTIATSGGGSSSFTTGSVGSAAEHRGVEYKNCKFKFSSTTQEWRFAKGRVRFICCSFASGSTIPTNVWGGTTNPGGTYIEMDGCDWSAAGAGKTLFINSTRPDMAYLVDCKIDPSVTINGTFADAACLELYLKYTSASNINYDYKVRKYAGSIDADASQYITQSSDGGASDGVTSYCHKYTGNANAKFGQPFRGEWTYVRNTTTAANVNVRFEILYDGAADLNNDEIWIEGLAMTDASSPIATLVDDRRALVGSAAAQAAGVGAAAWTKGVAGVGWRSQKIDASYTSPQIQKVGYIKVRVCLAANKVVLVNPKPILS